MRSTPLFRRANTAISLAALALAACASGAPRDTGIEPITLSPATQAELTSYLAKVKATRPGAFAVSPDGRTSYYTWCDDITCMTYTYSMVALHHCQGLAGTRCVLLYRRDEPLVPFTRASVESGAPDGRHGSQEQEPIDFENRHVGPG